MTMEPHYWIDPLEDCQPELESMVRTMHTEYFQEVARTAFRAFAEINEALDTAGFGPISTLGELSEWTGVTKDISGD